MSKIKQLVRELNKETARLGLDVFPPASFEDIEAAKIRFNELFNFQIPTVYIEIWYLSNGLETVGLEIYRCKDEGVDADLIDSNLIWRKDPGANMDYLYFAESDDDENLELYCYDPINKEFLATILDGNVWKKFQTAEEMLIFAMERGLEKARSCPEDSDE